MFSSQTIQFLKELKANNNRDWFHANKSRYEEKVREPSLHYIEAMADPLMALSPYFVASAKKTGGSLMRIHRDIRFGNDKTPYKTNIGIQFRHAAGKDVHAPGFYLHLEPGNFFLAAGMWAPDTPTLTKVRTLIDEYPDEWASLRRKVVNQKSGFELHGESLKRAPKGFDPEHAQIEDLRRKHYIVSKQLTQKVLTSKDVVKETTAMFKKTTPLVKFICEACDLDY